MILPTSLVTLKRCRTAAIAAGVGPFHVPIVPMSVKAPVAALMLYIEMLFEAEFVT